MLQLSDLRRYELLTRPWIPDANYQFPRSGPKNLCFKYGWLSRWPWIVYSPSKDGALCKCCSLFAGAGGGKGSQDLGVLVKRPFQNWNKATETFDNHQKHLYHKRCIEAADFFRGTHENKEKEANKPVDVQLDTTVARQIEQNRSALRPLISTILLCGRQGISLRGTEDSGPVPLLEPEINDGNYRALLRFRVNAGDVILRNHLQNSAKNAMWTSAQIQNEIISACNSIILKKLCDRVNGAKCFSVLADETTDVATMQQMSIIARYIDENNKLREDFLQFEPVSDSRGVALAETIVSSLKKYGLHLEFLRGQGYDGAAAMSGEFQGAQAYIRQQFPLARYVHCASHVFNLAVCDACEILPVRNTIGTAKAIHAFYKTPKRLNALVNVFKEQFPDKKVKRLKQVCETRWVEKHEAIITLLDILTPVTAALEDIEHWNDRDAASSAHSLLLAIRNSSFVVTLVILAKVMASSLILSRELQATNLDFLNAIHEATCLNSTLATLRENAEEEFQDIFEECTNLAREIGAGDIVAPTTTKRQTKRVNVPANTAEEYFRRAVYVPFLDSVMTQLDERFLAHKNILEEFSCLAATSEIPTAEQKNHIRELSVMYEEDVNCSPDASVGELVSWCRYISTLHDTLRTALGLLAICDRNIYTAIWKLLQILCTIPVTTSAAERSFSTLRWLKGYLRSTMKEDRLNGLALLSIHKDIPIDANEVLDEMAKVPRRLQIGRIQ